MPATSPPPFATQVRVPTNALSTIHHQPQVAVKWNLTCTADCPAAAGSGTSRCPVTSSVVRSQTLVQVVPPSVLRSTSATWPLIPL